MDFCFWAKLAQGFSACSIGDRLRIIDALQRAGPERPRGIVRECRFNADDPAIGLKVACRDGIATEQSATATGYQQHVELTAVRQQFQCCGPLPSDNMRMIERWNQAVTVFAGEFG